MSKKRAKRKKRKGGRTSTRKLTASQLLDGMFQTVAETSVFSFRPRSTVTESMQRQGFEQCKVCLLVITKNNFCRVRHVQGKHHRGQAQLRGEL